MDRATGVRSNAVDFAGNRARVDTVRHEPPVCLGPYQQQRPTLQGLLAVLRAGT